MPEQLPISVCIIAKNEPLLQKAIDSVRPWVKEIVVVDTGSTHYADWITNTNLENPSCDIFQIYKEANNQETGLIEDFSKARNYCFSLATQPWILWLDADDEIGNPENLSALLAHGETVKAGGQQIGFILPYEYAYDGNKVCIYKQYRERLFSGKDHFHWADPVHEVCLPNNNTPCTLQIREEVFIKHHRQYSSKQEESGRNLRILRKHFETNKTPRTHFYFGCELINQGLIEEGIEILTTYVKISNWDHEAFMACDRLFNTYYAMAMQPGNSEEKKKECLENALHWAFKGVESQETWSEGYISICKAYYQLAEMGGHMAARNWQKCVFFGKLGLSQPPTKTLLFVNPMEREFEVYKYLHYAYNRQMRIQEALDCVNAALKVSPEDPTFLHNRAGYEAFLARIRIQEDVHKLRNAAKISPMFSKMDDERLALALAIVIDDENLPLPEKLVELLKEPGKLDIVFACGDAWEDWNPQIMAEKGIGGSETAVVKMAELLGRRGHRVRVFTSCGKEANYGAVEYRKSHRLKPDTECDVLIAWRNAPLLAMTTASIRLLWVHDVYAMGGTPENLLLANRILALSQWHKQNIMTVHGVPDSQVFVTRNGIDLNRFKMHRIVSRNPHKAIYSSSADRGLAVLLHVWPRIRLAVPDAELHIFYGFFNWKKMAEATKNANDLANIAALERVIEENKNNGVVYHGRVDQDTLAKEMCSAGVWAHPTWFTETYCITAAEAQAAGLYTVTSKIAALIETVGDRGVLLEGEWTSPAYMEMFVSNVIMAMVNPSEDHRDSLMNYADEHFSWDGVADQWEKLFNELQTESDDVVLPAFVSAK